MSTNRGVNTSSLLPAHLRPRLKSAPRHLVALWSSFGAIYQVHLKTAPHSLILKHVDAPVDSHSSESHLRKLISYRVERYFYAHLASRLSARVAAHYPVDPGSRDTALLLEDLTAAFPHPASRRYCGEEQAGVVLRWIAGFHAAFWGKVDEIPDTPPPLEVQNPRATEGVWQHGGYWYHATRSDEYAAMREDPEYDWLTERHVNMVAEYLADPKRPGRTLLHGDLKAANILFSGELDSCACYDFQYCGKGLGVVDLVYFLSTSVDARIMGNPEAVERLLDVYYQELQKQVLANGDDMGGYTKEGMMQDLDMAKVDWYRFQAGWGFWSNGFASESKVKTILARLDEQAKAEV
jgi:hypothetical protein